MGQDTVAAAINPVDWSGQRQECREVMATWRSSVPPLLGRFSQRLERLRLVRALRDLRRVEAMTWPRLRQLPLLLRLPLMRR